jgi:hypothetical protein
MLSADSNPRSLIRFQTFVPLRTAHPVGVRRLTPDLAENVPPARFPGARSPYGLPTNFQAPFRGPVVCCLRIRTHDLLSDSRRLPCSAPLTPWVLAGSHPTSLETCHRHVCYGKG